MPFQNSSGQVGALTLTQPLLKNFWIDSTRLNVRVGKNRLQYSEQGLREQIITSVTAVENAYYELIYAQENVKVQQEALKLAQTQLDQDKQRVQIGTLAQLDVQQDEAQVASSQANLIAAQSTLEHGPKHAEKSAHRRLCAMARHVDPADGDARRRRCNCSTCRTAGTRA